LKSTINSSKKNIENKIRFSIYLKVNMQGILLLLLLLLSKDVLSSNDGCLYGIDRSSLIASFVKIVNNSTKYDRLLSLGPVSISGPATATKSIDNQNYIVTYYISDSHGVPHYYILTIDINNTPKVKINATITGSGIGSFWQIADDQKQIVGIRDSLRAGASLELATINQTNGQVKTLGLYPYGSYSIIMAFAQQRRLYYNIIDNLFCGINVDTGKLDINITIPNDYSIYGIIYDSLTDRLISLVYSSKVVQNAWFIAEIITENNSTIKFKRIGKSIIPMGDKYFWSTTYTLALKQRQWITLWANKNAGYNEDLINFNIDTGEIVQQQTINNSKYLNNVVYFD